MITGKDRKKLLFIIEINTKFIVFRIYLQTHKISDFYQET